MAIRNLTVTFHTDVREWKGKPRKKGFNFPKALAQAFGKKSRKKQLTLHLVITKPSNPPGEPAFEGRARLVSGTEITRPKIFRQLKKGEEIRVKACDPILRPRIRKK